MAEPTSKELLSRFRGGQSRAADEIFDRYVRRLIELARQRISPKLARRVDPEDVVQSAYRSFFVHARDGEFVLRRAGDLWRLLAGIALNKLHGQIERHTAQRRDIGREEETTDASGNVIDLNVRTPEPAPDEVAAVTEQLGGVMQRIGSTERRVLEMRLQGRTIEEIADEIDRSQRTVRRLLEKVRRDMERQLCDG